MFGWPTCFFGVNVCVPMGAQKSTVLEVPAVKPVKLLKLMALPANFNVEAVPMSSAPPLAVKPKVMLSVRPDPKLNVPPYKPSARALKPFANTVVVPVPICPIWSNITFAFGVNICVVVPIKLMELFPGNIVENPDILKSPLIISAALFRLTEPVPKSVTIVSKTDVVPKSKPAPEEMEIVSIFIPHELFTVTMPALMVKFEVLRLVLPCSIDKAPIPLWIIFGRTQTGETEGGGFSEWAEEPIN
jgi:hypothetical protein